MLLVRVPVTIFERHMMRSLDGSVWVDAACVAAGRATSSLARGPTEAAAAMPNNIEANIVRLLILWLTSPDRITVRRVMSIQITDQLCSLAAHLTDARGELREILGVRKIAIHAGKADIGDAVDFFERGHHEATDFVGRDILIAQQFKLPLDR